MTRLFGSLLVCCLLAPTLRAEAPKPAETPAPEEADIQKIREKYWTRGNEAEVGVVQNRMFSKRHKFETGLTFDTVYGDPFLSTKLLTASVGYHFDELKSLHLTFSKAFVSNSSALDTLQRQNGTTANTNEPRWLMTAEGRGSLLYGKVSLLGASILHFDAYVSLGTGLVNTESGSNFLLTGGIGQLLHINQLVTLNLAYKVMWYRETILGKVSGVNGNLGQNLGTRSNLSSVLMVGVSFLIDPVSPKEQPVKPVDKPATTAPAPAAGPAAKATPAAVRTPATKK